MLYRHCELGWWRDMNEVKLKKWSKYFNCPGQRIKGERDVMIGTGKRETETKSMKLNSCMPAEEWNLWGKGHLRNSAS